MRNPGVCAGDHRCTAGQQHWCICRWRSCGGDRWTYSKGLAYLELFGHRGKYYELHVAHKPRWGGGAVPLPYVAHSDAKVCCPGAP